MTSFGENLKQIRSDKNLSQGQLAEIIGMHSTHISRYERNLASPTIEVVKKIAEALNVSADNLIYGNSQQKANNQLGDSELLSLFSKVQSLKNEDVNVIKSLINAYVLKTDLQNRLVS